MDDALTANLSEQGAERRLQVGRKPGVVNRLDFNGLEAITGPDPDTTRHDVNAGTALCQLVENRVKVFRHDVMDLYVTTSCHRGDCEAPGLHPIRDHPRVRPPKSSYPSNLNSGRAGTLNSCAHPVEMIRKCDNFRFARRISYRRRAFREARCHHEVFGTRMARIVEVDAGPAQAGRLDPKNPINLLNGRAHRLKTADVNVDGTFSQVAAARAWRLNVA
jgi:hypothetical protein